MFDAATGTFAANKVMRELVESGAIGSVETKTNETKFLSEALELMPGDAIVIPVENSYAEIPSFDASVLTVGASYIIHVDDARYVCEYKHFDLAGYTYFGNLRIISDTDIMPIGSEPFVIAVIPGGVGALFAISGSVSSVSLSISKEEVTETIHPIDPKYLPEGGVGYTTKTVLLDGVFTPNESGFIPTNITDIKVGDEVKVTWNGVVYDCVARAYNEEGITAVVFGNTVMIDGVDNGVPFIHMSGVYEGTPTGQFITESIGESISIKMTTETVHTIEPKYVPSALPVVVLSSSEGEFSAEENAALTACIGSPIIVKMGADSSGFAALASYHLLRGTHYFALLTMGNDATNMCIKSADGVTWEVTTVVKEIVFSS